ncbi:MAG: fumarylacetoacetate hydrolase family protein [Alicyclobacillaceae bacterium]|nr:fumarylacetoacetate hydrolase family protein [Alicyclobacillaceae bacterium]
MRIALFNGNRLGVVQADRIADVTEAVGWDATDAHRSLVRLISRFGELRGTIEQALAKAPTVPLSSVSLDAPVPNPSKIVAAPVNYRAHQQEMQEEFTVERLGFFLKAPSSIIGPGGTILLPYKDRRTDHEAELAFVVGKTAKDVPASQAAEYIFGYFGLMDITVRGREDRPMRKSFDTFTPIGPWIVTADEVGNPHELDIRLWVNDELRQSANTRDLIQDCYRFFETVSRVMTLYPGDIITTGTPEGVGPIQAGDRVRLEIERIGELAVGVADKS